MRSTALDDTALENTALGNTALGNTALDNTTFLADPTLHALYEFTELIAANVRSSRQRERVVRAAKVPLASASLNALRIIDRHAPIAISDLARRLGVDQSTASRQLRPLEEERLAYRTTADDDRRVAWMSLTPKGKRVVERTTEVWLADYELALEDWSAADRATLGELLERLRTDLSKSRLPGREET